LWFSQNDLGKSIERAGAIRYQSPVPIKTLLPLCALALLLGSGCARNYVMTLNNGTQLGAKGKPRLENGSYYFTDARGEKTSISAGRVSQIEPASEAARDEKQKSSRR
jgi:hypothetical protein